MDDAADTTLLLSSEDVPPVPNSTPGTLAVPVDLRPLWKADPARLDDLGLPESERTRHIAWDIGIAGVAEALSQHLGAHLIVQRYSRLVIDCNRPPDAASSIPRISEATTISGNEGISREATEMWRARSSILITGASARSSTSAAALPCRRCWCRCTALRRSMPGSRVPGTSARSITATHLPPLLLKLLRAEGDLVVGDNEPYAVSDETDYTIPMHGEARGLMNTGIEIRQDLIGDPAGEKAWADRLARIFGEIEVDCAAAVGFFVAPDPKLRFRSLNHLHGSAINLQRCRRANSPVLPRSAP